MCPTSLLTLFFWLQCIQCYCASAQQTINPDDTPSGLMNTTAWSLIYTYPLTVFANYAGSTLRRVDTNEFLHFRKLATPATILFQPNSDVLYSGAVLDLSQKDIVLTIPEIAGNRFWLYPVYDVFGNAIVELGIVNGNSSGDYLIRRADDGNATPGYQSGKGTKFQGIVNLPGTYATMLVRILVRQNTTQEIETVDGYQSASHLTLVDRKTSLVNAPTVQSTALNGTFFGIDTPEQQLEFAARLIPYNKPEVLSDRTRVANILTEAGLRNGHYHQPANLNLTKAAVIANGSIAAAVVSPKALRSVGNGWVLQTPAYQGNYGTHYAEAAFVALDGYQVSTSVQTLYPQLTASNRAGFYELAPNTAWMVTFSGKPKLQSAGFWSFSVYGTERRLISNPINRYEVGDRTWTLRYEDGSGPVYGPEADKVTDGPFQILVQPASLPPPKNWTNNWLPTHSIFALMLRWYVPEPAMADGSYVYPKVETIAAIV